MRFGHSIYGAASALALMGVGSRILFAPDGGDGGGAGGAAGGGAGGTPPPATVSKEEAEKAFKARDKAKAAFRATLTTLGVDPDEVEVVETGDADNPYQVKGLETVTSLLETGRKGANKGAKWEDRERELLETNQKKLQKTTGEFTRRETGLKGLVSTYAVTAPIREAAAAEGALDAEGVNKGKYLDIVTALAPRIRTEIVHDEETGAASVKVTCLDEDGTILVDKDGKPADVRALVSKYLAARPHMKRSNFRPGPGAGGNGAGGAPGANAATVGRSAAAALFGRKAS